MAPAALLGRLRCPHSLAPGLGRAHLLLRRPGYADRTGSCRLHSQQPHRTTQRRRAPLPRSAAAPETGPPPLQPAGRRRPLLPLLKRSRRNLCTCRSGRSSQLSRPLTCVQHSPRLLECEHFAACSGCTQRSLDRPPIFEQAQQFFRSHGLSSVQLDVGPVHGWRCRARLAVRGRAGRLSLGLFAAGSHSVVDIPNCSIHHARLNQAAEAVRAAAEALRVRPYVEHTGEGQLRYLQLTVAGREASGWRADRDADAPVQVVLVWNGEAADAQLKQLAQQLWQADQGQQPPLLHSVWVNFNASRGNAVLGARYQLLQGQRWLWQELGGVRACFAPGSFAQANFGAMDAALAAIQAAVPLGAAVADLHAGVGVIGLAVAAARRCRLLCCVELSAQGEEAFGLAAAAAAQAGMATPTEYVVAAAGSAPQRFLAGVDACIVDPPRKGLEPALLAALAARGGRLRTLVYLSCGFASLRRDATELLRGGRWRLASARCFLFFPGTDSVETLAVFVAAE